MWRECVSHYTGNQLTLFFFFINIITVSFKDCILWPLISYCDRHLKHKYPNAHTVVAIVIGLQVCVCVSVQWYAVGFIFLRDFNHNDAFSVGNHTEVYVFVIYVYFDSIVCNWHDCTLTENVQKKPCVIWCVSCRWRCCSTDAELYDGTNTHTHTHTHVWQSCIWIWVSQVFTLSRCVWLS